MARPIKSYPIERDTLSAALEALAAGQEAKAKKFRPQDQGRYQPEELRESAAELRALRKRVDNGSLPTAEASDALRRCLLRDE